MDASADVASLLDESGHWEAAWKGLADHNSLLELKFDNVATRDPTLSMEGERTLFLPDKSFAPPPTVRFQIRGAPCCRAMRAF